MCLIDSPNCYNYYYDIIKTALHMESCICVSQINGTCSEVHRIQYGRLTGSLGDESSINTLCKSVRSAFSDAVSGTTLSPVILFVLPFLSSVLSTYCVTVPVNFFCLNGVTKARVVYHVTHPTPFFQSHTSHFCPPCLFRSSTCGQCLASPHIPTGLWSW